MDDPLAEAKRALADGRNETARRLLADRMATHPDDEEAEELLRTVLALEGLPAGAPDVPGLGTGGVGGGGRSRVPPPPLGVVILAFLIGFGAILLLAAGFIAWGLGSGLGVVGMMVGTFQLVTAVGLYRLRTWAWWVAVVLCALGIVTNLLRLGVDPFAVFPLAVQALTLGYLALARHHFPPSSAAPAA